MERTYTTDAVEQKGKVVTVKGWVNSRRDHGGVIFIDVRDYKGVLQLTIHPQAEAAFAVAQDLRDEFVIKAIGEITEREESLKNPQLATGAVELVVTELTVLNKSEALPIQVNTTQYINEESRLKYRYLDLRRPKMQMMLKKRAELYRNIRAYMDEREFIEIQTPILANSSPEGARDFLIPSRIHQGSFYALPQAPQQFKQLLMVGGVSRYYQMAACFRDEDPRADRLYGEFYQLDLEMSFVEDGEEVRSTIEPLIVDLVKNFAGKTLHEETIPRIPYSEAMERYGIDKPDLRYGMELVELSEEVKHSGFGVFANTIKDGGCVKAILAKGAESLSRSQIDNFTEIAKREGAGGLAYITVKNGEAVSPITKFFSPEELTIVMQKMGAGDGDVIFFGADKREVVNKVLGRLRIEFADHFKLKDPNVVALAWIVDFPFYEWDEQNKKLDFGHNPFSMPKGGLDALKAEDKLGILADQYDMVMNGYEICSGGVRNHNPDVLYEVFGLLGFDKAYVESKFGAMLNAFKYGAPPHAGCAYGLDRMFMELMSEDNVREVVAFPKNGSGVDLMTGSPSAPDPKLIKELGIKVATAGEDEKHPVKQQILDLVKQHNLWHETFEHAAVRTSEEASKARSGYSLQQGAKALIVRTRTGGNKKFFMLVMPADQKFSDEKVKQALGVEELGFASEEEVAEITKGVKPGAVPPFGSLFGLEVITDKTLYGNEKIVFNAGERTFSLAMKSEDYKQLVKPRVEDIV